MARPQSTLLTPKQDQAVQLMADGLSTHEVAKRVYNTNNIQRISTPAMKEALANARENLVDITMIRRVDIVNGILDQIHKADQLSDPSTAIKGWTEIGKMLGHYEPEKIRIELSVNQGRLKSKMEAMSDAELLAIAEGRQTLTLDGECTEVSP